MPTNRLQSDSLQTETSQFWNVPNSLCILRLCGAFLLICVALLGSPIWFVGLYLVFAVSDLIDGPLARWLDQQTSIGAGLDSIADVALSISLLVGAMILSWQDISSELIWIALACVSYAFTAAVTLRKFGKLPSFHTYSAKLTHFLIAIGGISLIMGWSAWPLRVAMLSMMIANVEGLLIARSLKAWQSDVPSVWMLKREQGMASP